MKTTIDLMERPEVEADLFFKLMDNAGRSLREYRLISAAFELGVFEALETPSRAGPLAERLGCDPALMPYFCEALCELALLYRLEDGGRAEKDRGSEEDEVNKGEGPVYANTRLSSTYLLKTSSFSLQHYLSEKERDSKIWARLPEIMIEGPVVFPKADFFGRIIHSMAESSRCGLLQETVRTVTENVDFTKAGKLLDLGGGHGLYAIAFAGLYKELEAFVFDLPLVTEQTKVYIEKYSADRVRVITGDFFKDELGEGYDIIFSSFNPGGKVPELIPKIAGALNEGGIFVTRQVRDEKADSDPLANLAWNLWTFADTKKGGSGFTFENSVPFDEYVEMLGDYGLEVKKLIDMKDGSRIVFAEKKSQAKI
ncbi:MAG: methyltransferase [Methanosarcinaceae archaeon]|nr:methyltransferase [Methanosarcinaceae archaeon]